MSDTSVSPCALVLDGQGLPATISSQAIQIAIDDSKTPLGSAILLACHEAFIKEHNALSAEERAACGIDLQHVPTSQSLLELPTTYPANAIVANTHLYLTQLLRWVACSLPGPFGASEQDAGIFGFSTGMFAAVVIASSTTIAGTISNAVEVYRAAFWLGLRAQLFSVVTLGRLDRSMPQSWSLVTFGSPRSEVEAVVGRYNAEHVGKSSYMPRTYC